MTGATQPPVSLLRERFLRLPIDEDLAFEGALVRYPDWIRDGQAIVRPWAFLWAGVGGGPVAVSGPFLRPEERSHEGDLAALVRVLNDRRIVGARPARIRLVDHAFAEWLRDLIAGGELAVELVESTPDVAELLRRMTAELSQAPRMPALLSGDGVTPDLVRRFAGAAAAFHRRAPWEDLTNDDRIEIKGASIPRGFGHVVVMGHAGEVFGLAFFGSREEFVAAGSDRLQAGGRISQTYWAVTFDPPWGLCLADVDDWEGMELPVAAPDAYPLIVGLGPGKTVHRPAGPLLEFVTHVLEALAVATPADFDSGRWSCSRPGAGASGTLAFELPALLEEPPLDPGAQDPVSAMELALRAAQFDDRRRHRLAREALRLDPDCCKAWMVLAEAASTTDRQLACYEEAASAGRRSLGEGFLTTNRGGAWDVPVARLFFRARRATAECLMELRRFDEAERAFSELLELDPSDKQACRNELMVLRIRNGDSGGLGEALALAGDHEPALTNFARAIHVRGLEGESPAAGAALARALKANPWVPKYLAGKRAFPSDLPRYFRPGSEEEGLLTARQLQLALEERPEIVAWIAQGVQARKKERKTRRKR